MGNSARGGDDMRCDVCEERDARRLSMQGPQEVIGCATICAASNSFDRSLSSLGAAIAIDVSVSIL